MTTVGATTTHPQAPEDTTGARALGDPFAELVRLARSASTRSRLLGEALRCIARFFQSPYAALHVRYSAEVFQDDCHFGPTDPRFWKASLQEFLTESLSEGCSRAKLLRAKTGPTKVAFLSARVFDPSGPAIGAIALVVSDVNELELTTRLATLDALCRLASFSAEFIGRGHASEQGPGVPDRAMLRVAGGNSVVELVFAITNELRNKIDCEQVALGLVDRNRVRLLSVSGFEQIARQSPGIAALQAAMEECLDAGKVIVHQRSSQWSEDEGGGQEYGLHKQWHTVSKGACVASVPLRADDKTIAILSLRNRADQPFSRETLDEVRARTEPLVPALELARRAQRSLLAHAREHVRAGTTTIVTPGHLSRKVGAVLFTLAALWFCFGKMSYDITVPCVVTPAEMRHLAAPIGGVLIESLVVAGDRVTEGQLLCRFDDRDLQQQREQYRAELTVLERRRDQARAADSPVEVRLAEASQHLTRTKLKLVERRIAQTEVRAPYDGIVVSGDLRRGVGSVLRQGEPLFAVAPFNAWALEMELPEYATADVTASLRGTFASYAKPEDIHTLTLTRVIPNVTVLDRNNVFIAEADIDEQSGTLRPGMEGVANVHIGRRAVWWVMLHRVIDYLRLRLWL